MEHQIPVNEHLTLCSFVEEDKANLLKYMNDPVLYGFTMRIPSPYTETDADKFLMFTVDRREELCGVETNFAIRHNSEGVIGGIGVFVHTGLNGHRDEFGYWLAQPFRNQGIMTEVVKSFTAWQFETRPSLLRLEALVMVHNVASVRLLEKAGYGQEGLLRKYLLKNEEPVDAKMMARLR